MIRKSLAVRIVLATLVSGVVGAVIALGFVGRVVNDAFSSQLAPLLVSRFDGRAARDCQAQPGAWSMRGWLIRSLQGYAYDARTGTSANPAAPPLRGDLVDDLGAGPAAFALDQRGAGSVGTLVFRTTAPAPCDLVQLTWNNPAGDQRTSRIVVGSAIASALLASAIGLFVLVLPLVRRIRRLSAAATRVGEPAGYAPGRRPPGDELDALADALDRAHVRIRTDAGLLEDQRDALERHLARVAHDLRTPLTSMQIVLEYAADLSSEPAVQDALSGALRDAVYLAGLIHNLRLASKLRSGWDPTDDVAEVDLADLVTRIVGRARILARRRQIDLGISVPDEPLRVRCNAIAVEQALANVIDNAVAYNDPQGHVAVVLTAHGAAFELAVRDDGPGIAPADLPRLGQATFRSDDARQRDPRGSGLGLAITAEVCARIGWTLRFSALEPRGLLVEIHGDAAAA